MTEPSTNETGLRLAWSRAREEASLAEASEETLLAAVRDGDEEAFEALVERTTPDLLRWVARYLGDLEEARDVVQVAYLNVWRRRQGYDPERGGGRAWLLSIATHAAIDRLRRRQRRRRTHEEVARLETGRIRPVGESWRGGEVERLFRRLAERLTPRQQAAFLLREVEDRSTSETAALLRCEPSTVRSLVAQARSVLRRELARHFPEYLPASHSREGA